MAHKPITPEIVSTAQNAAPTATPAVYSPSTDAPAALIPVRGGSGYRVLFVAVDGCGGTRHNFGNLEALQRDGVQVDYVNANPVPDRMPIRNPSPPQGARQVNSTFEQGAQILSQYGLSVFSSTVLLIGPDNRVVGQFDSRSGSFVRDVESRIPQQARGNGYHL